jgi:Flp pilus assembly protein TadD
MNKLKFLSLVLFSIGFSSVGQEIELAKKAIDAEQFEKAKSILKSALKVKPDNGKIAFLLGNVYLKQSFQDSAKAVFQKGLALKEFAAFNHIGLGQIDLNNGNAAAAQFNFDQSVKDTKKKDIEQFIYIGQAFTNAEKPDFKKAIFYIEKAKFISPNDPQMLLALGDAYYAEKNQNEAYKYYSNAFDADPTLIRAKLQLGVLLKETNSSFAEAKSAFDGIVASNPNYGPVYRELAETFFRWGNKDKSKYKEYTSKSLGYYEKYMSLTDYSLASRFRRAEFLIIAKDYVALEKEANEMKALDKVNPRILRYLGYSFYENGKPEESIKVLTEYISNPANKIIGRDYLYLGLAQLKIATPVTASVDIKPVINDVLFQTAITNLQKAVNLDKPMANDLNDIGKLKYFDLKLYKYAAAIFEVATSNPNSRNFLYDNFYLGYAIYFDNSGKKAPEKVDVVALKKADKAFDNVILASATTQEAYIYRARVNGLLAGDVEAQAQMAKSYEDYIKVVTDKGAVELDKPANKTKFVEAYQNLAIYHKKDKLKAVSYLLKALAIEPADPDLLNLQKALK